MGKTRLTWMALAAAALLAGTSGSAVPAAGPSRFASYDTESDCVAARTLAPSVCRIAFARARSEYEAKTPSFATQALCTRRYASCMAWPPGADSPRATYRPAWDGVDIVDTPSEHSVTPSPGRSGRDVRFAARPLTDEPAALVIRRAGTGAPVSPSVRGGRSVTAGRPGIPGAAAPFTRHAAGASGSVAPPSAPPPPGSGFKLEDGVLTYPAPARFQPKNLPKGD